MKHTQIQIEVNGNIEQSEEIKPCSNEKIIKSSAKRKMIQKAKKKIVEGFIVD